MSAYNKDRKELDKRITENSQSSRRPWRCVAKTLHCELQQGLAQGNPRHCGIATYRAVLQPLGGADAINGLATGSSRSVQGFDIYKPVESARDLLEKLSATHTLSACPPAKGGEHCQIYQAL